MLINLHVKNLALIDEADVFFDEGLNILTGETGAGKSILLGSINLALGAKASRDILGSMGIMQVLNFCFRLMLPLFRRSPQKISLSQIIRF